MASKVTGGQRGLVRLWRNCSSMHIFIIRYYKTSDPAGWVTIDRNTGELRVANTIDRESAFALNGTYNVNVRAVDTSKLLVAVFFLTLFLKSCCAAKVTTRFHIVFPAANDTFVTFT